MTTLVPDIMGGPWAGHGWKKMVFGAMGGPSMGLGVCAHALMQGCVIVCYAWAVGSCRAWDGMFMGPAWGQSSEGHYAALC